MAAEPDIVWWAWTVSERVAAWFVPQANITAESGTAVTVEHGGWGEGDGWEQARQWHVAAWDGVLASLKSALESRQGNLGSAPE